MQGPARDTLRLLCQVKDSQHNRRLPQVVDDWVELVQATLLTQPRHLAYTCEYGTLAGFVDDEPMQALWARLREIYPAKSWDLFAQAYGHLLAAPTDQGDLMGPLYMQGSWANERLGQFFTPQAVAHLLAGMSGIDAVIWGRLRIAYEQSGFGKLIPLPTLEDPSPTRLKEAGPIVQGVWKHLAPHYEPVWVLEPACGSGVMILAVAESLPAWVNQMGLIHYYGVDLDLGCVRMCHIQMLLRGLHGVVRHGNGLTDPQPGELHFASPLVYPQFGAAPTPVPAPVPPQPAIPLLSFLNKYPATGS